MNKGISCVLSSVLLLASPICLADVQIAFAGISGEVASKWLPDAIPLSSVAMGASAPASTTLGTRLTAGKVTFSELVFTKARGAASAGLEKALFSGRPIERAQLRITRPGTSNAYFLVTLEDVLVTSWQTSVDDSGSAMDSFSIAFSRIRTEDVITNPDGTKASVPVGWDIPRNMAF